MQKNIFLDAGGVILNEAIHERERALLSVELIRKYKSGYSAEEYSKDVEEAVYIYESCVYRYIFWKNLKNPDIYRDLYNEYLEKWKTRAPELELMDGLEEVLVYLSPKYKIGILGQYDSWLCGILENNNLLKYFAFRSTQDNYKITKPDPRYFEQILADAGVKPEVSIMVGDRIDKDVIPAKMIGMKTVRVRTGIHKNQEPRIPEEAPDYDVADIRGLINVL